MSKKDLLLRRILPLLVLLAGGAIAYWLIATKPKPEKSAPQVPGLLVETVNLQKSRERFDVNAQGTVIPARRVNVQPQVSGKVLSVNPALRPGGILKAGERLLSIDPADFRLAVSQRETELKEARAALRLEQGRQKVAEDEWALFKEEFEVAAQTPALALREPQLASARARVERAEAALRQARLQLQRTVIEAPFHALVIEESVAEGQFVQPQQGVAQIVGADRFRVRVSVAPDKIPYIRIPFGKEDKGSAAEVLLDLGTERIRFDGYVSRLEGRLDEQSRMAQLIVTIPDPLGPFGRAASPGKTPTAQEKFPLLLNAYVDVHIRGGQAIDVFVVPRGALHNGNQVYVYEDGRLRIRTLDIAWERPDAVLARAGLQEGERVITSSISSPVEGMRLRLQPVSKASAQ